MDMRQQLFSIYCDSVDPLCKIIHRPSVQSQIDSIYTSVEVGREEAGIHATLFAIYGAATISLPANKYSQLMDEPKDCVLRRYRFATEYYLSKADYMESRKLEPLQAFSIYLVSYQIHDTRQIADSSIASGPGSRPRSTALGIHSASDTACERTRPTFSEEQQQF